MTDKPRPVETWDNYRYEIVPIENLFVDKDYQRRLTNLAREIGEDMIPALLPTFLVSARKESRGHPKRVTLGAVFDGQTRLEGSKRWNSNIQKGDKQGKLVEAVPCTVYTGLTQAEEAQLFVWIQTKRRNATSYEAYYAMLKAPEWSEEGQEARALKEIVESTGYEIGYARMSGDTIPSVSALRTLYRRDPETLERTLTIFRSGWKSKHTPSAPQLRGMARFLRENPDIDDERLVVRLGLNGPADLDDKAQSANALSGKKRSDADMSEAIKSVYLMRPSQVEKKLQQAA